MNIPLRAFPALIAGLSLLFLTACSSDSSLSEDCAETSVTMTVAGKPHSLGLVSSNMIRVTNASGSYKLLNLEAITDSLKFIVNINSGRYANYNDLQTDSIPTGVYTYSSRTGKDTAVRMLIGIRNATGYKYAITDTAMLNITAIDLQHHTISGNYFVETTSPQVTATGTFHKLCFQSIK